MVEKVTARTEKQSSPLWLEGRPSAASPAMTLSCTSYLPITQPQDRCYKIKSNFCGYPDYGLLESIALIEICYESMVGMRSFTPVLIDMLRE